MILFMRCKRLQKERRLELCRVAVVAYITARVPNNVDKDYGPVFPQQINLPLI